MKHRTSYARETGKSLMHAAPHGQGSHYLMFDYCCAAQAVATLPPDERRPYRTALLEILLRARTADGGFLDNPINGSHYAAGMALRTIGLLQADE